MLWFKEKARKVFFLSSKLFLKTHQAIQLSIVLGRGDDSFSLDTISATGILQFAVSHKQNWSSHGPWTVVVFALCTKGRRNNGT